MTEFAAEYGDALYSLARSEGIEERILEEAEALLRKAGFDDPYGTERRRLSTEDAARLAEAWRAPVCVRCGIHYHEPTRAQLAEIVASCDMLLEKLIFLERCEGVEKS